MRAIKESIGRDYRAIRGAVDIGTRNHKGERDGGLASKWLGLGLVALILIVRTLAPLFGVPEANLPGIDTFMAALSLTFGVEGFYLFRRSYDLRREDKKALMQLNRTPASAPPAPAPAPPPMAPFIISGNELIEAQEDLALEETAAPAPAPEPAPSPRPSLRERLSARLKARQAPPAAEEAPSAPIEPRPSGEPASTIESNDSAPDALHRQAPVEEEGEVTPSGQPSSSAPSGARLPPLPAPKRARAMPIATPAAPPVTFPEEVPVGEGLGDIDDDPEQQADEDQETGQAPGRSAMGSFNFDDDDFDNSFAPFADDPAGGVEGFETESDEDVEQPRTGPRGRAGGPRGRAPGKPTI